ncbi:hypothetical protein HGP16_21140 [Rhizobium sp. P40RR-XXII]|uniref:hypothetical protein n=1 Tax=unclassified Rhizobium TaxID=2613769 RepID=UPI001456F96E|nr:MULTISPECIES: hypothetical protein [unclassified Rhizobium]NLR88052.1 hypothetical protein [Rhizobium sp. P28RR-XV]NLS19048.1 hypothetical protein [Rhizobium sp. P40RR-XXII]
MTAEPIATEEPELDPVEAALALYGGDARATIAAALGMLQFVRGQLALTEAAMCHGFTRGFTPVYEPAPHLEPIRS